jgi:hypothetical protein
VNVSRRAETKRDPFLCQKSDFGFHPARTLCASPLKSASEPEFDPARVEFGAHRGTRKGDRLLRSIADPYRGRNGRLASHDEITRSLKTPITRAAMKSVRSLKATTPATSLYADVNHHKYIYNKII